MSFEYYKWLPLVIVASILFFVYLNRSRNSYYGIIEKFWFFKPTKLSKIRFFTLLTSLIVFIVALMDLRGPEERIKATIPDQKTIIIIDSSASMLAEDVRPNRFKRSLFLARHFIKRAAGHQIAVVLFSDTQKRLVPFTDDIDLLDARVAALENTDIRYGNSNINQAVKESLQYFKIDNDSEKIVGNILLFTDSEEHGGVFPLEEGSDVNLAVVGVGTLAGAPLPMRSKSGVFLDYKKFKGEKVISKLNESAIKKMGDNFKNFKYWITTSYTIPTDEILSFFRGIYKKKLGETDIRIRPVYGHILIIIAILIYFASSLLSLGKTISKPLALFVLTTVLMGEPYVADAQEEQKKLVLDNRTRKLKAGNSTADEKKLIAQGFLREGKAKEATVLYEEINEGNDRDINSLTNLATAYAGQGNLEKALENYDKALGLMPEGESKEQLRSVIRNNTLLAIQQKKNKSKSKKNKKNKDKKDKKDKKDSEKKKEQEQDESGQSGDQNKQDQKQNKKKDQKQQKPKGNKKDGEKKEDQKKSPSEKPDEGKQEQKPASLEEKEKQIKQKRKMVKIPAMLKQIMDQDRNLQQKYYKTTNKKKRNRNERRDW